MSGVPVKPPLKPGRLTMYLNGVSRGRGTYFVLVRDPFLFGEVGEAYCEKRLPRRRIPKRVDVLGTVVGPPTARPLVLVRSYDEFGYIALRSRRLRAVLGLLRTATVRLLRGTPGRGPLRWQRVAPSQAGALHRLVVDPRDLPAWVRHPTTRRWMFEARARRRMLEARRQWIKRDESHC